MTFDACPLTMGVSSTVRERFQLGVVWLATLAGLMLGGGGERAAAPEGLRYEPQAAAMGVRTFRFDMLPQYAPAKIVRQYQPIMDHINQRLGGLAQLEMGVPPDFKTFEVNIRAGAADFVLGNPWHTTVAIDTGYQVIAMSGAPEDFKGLFVVRKDSVVTQPKDLKGKAISYPSPTALAAGMMPQWYLHQSGLAIQTETQSVYVGSQESAIMSVYLRQSQAGATWPPPWRQFQIDHPKEAAELKVVWETPALVNNGVVARHDVPVEVREQVTRALLELHSTAEGRKLLELTQTDRFYPANNSSYDAVRQFVSRFEQEVRAPEKR